MPDFAEQLVMDGPMVTEQPAPAPEVQPEPKPSEAASDGRPRNPDGTFAPKAKDEGNETGVKEGTAAPQPAPAQPTQPEPPAGEEGKHVPLAALNALKKALADRDAELAELRKPKPSSEQSQQTQPQTPNPSQNPTPKRPDFSFDPTIYEGNPEGLQEARFHQTKMDMSVNMAEFQFGEDKFREAWAAFDAACKADPKVNAWSFSPELRNHPHPMGEVWKWYQQQQEVTQLTAAGGLEKLRESIKAQILAEMQGSQPAPVTPAAAATPAAVPMPRPATPVTPPSLARGGAGSNSAPETLSDNDVFENIFDKSKRLSRKR